MKTLVACSGGMVTTKPCPKTQASLINSQLSCEHPTNSGEHGPGGPRCPHTRWPTVTASLHPCWKVYDLLKWRMAFSHQPEVYRLQCKQDLDYFSEASCCSVLWILHSPVHSMDPNTTPQTLSISVRGHKILYQTPQLCGWWGKPLPNQNQTEKSCPKPNPT